MPFLYWKKSLNKNLRRKIFELFFKTEINSADKFLNFQFNQNKKMQYHDTMIQLLTKRDKEKLKGRRTNYTKSCFYHITTRTYTITTRYYIYNAVSAKGVNFQKRCIQKIICTVISAPSFHTHHPSQS